MVAKPSTIASKAAAWLALDARLLPRAASSSRSDAPRGARPLLLAQNNGGGSGNGLNPGLYVQVLEGLINVHNGGGSQNFAAGQFGFTPSFTQPPVILPNNPGLQFNPPPSFSNTGGTQNGNGGKPGDVDCIVR